VYVVTRKKVIIIGAGLGGISAAVSLASEGYEVQVYEKNDKIGGKLNQLDRQGFNFDLGPSIMSLPHFFQKIFHRLNKRMEDYFILEELSPQWRCFFEDGKVFDIYSSIEKMKASSGFDGAVIEDMQRYLVRSKKMYEFSDTVYFQKHADNLRDVLKNYGLIGSLRDSDFLYTMDEVVSEHIYNNYLKDILNFFVKYVGSSPYDAPAILNLMHYMQFEYGIWYVKGGMYNIVRGFQRLMDELSVGVSLNCEVVKIILDGDRAAGIRTSAGEVRYADIIISNMELIPACERLLGLPEDKLNHYHRFEPTCSGVVMHLGVDRIYEKLEHHNFFFSQNPKEHFNSIFHDHQLPKDPTIYVVAPVKSDSSLAPPGHEIIKVLPHIPYIPDNPFSEGEYRAFREILLDKLERMGMTDLRRHIVVEEFWTPEDIQQRYYSNRGAIYGVVSDRKKNKGFKGPMKSEHYKDLYFVGGSINPGGGMPMVVLSGQHVRDMILKEDHSE
jgi:diapolycopene oxygenase